MLQVLLSYLQLKLSACLQLLILFALDWSWTGSSASVESSRANHPAGELCCYTKWPQSPSQLATCQFSCVPCCHGDGSWEETNGPTAAQRHLVTCWKLICSHIRHRLTLCLSWESNIISAELLWSWHFLHWARYLIKQSAHCLNILHISRLSEVRFTQMPQSFEVLPVSMVLAPSTNHNTMLGECERK